MVRISKKHKAEHTRTFYLAIVERTAKDQDKLQNGQVGGWKDTPSQRREQMPAKRHLYLITVTAANGLVSGQHLISDVISPGSVIYSKALL